MRTTDTCAECGFEIPIAPLGERALCTDCRYSKGSAVASWDSGGDLPGYQIDDDTGHPFGTGAKKDGDWIDREPFVDFDWGALGAGDCDRAEQNTIGCAIAEFLKMLTADSTALQSGQCAQLLAYLVGVSPFKTKRELADHLNISPGRISQIEADLPKELQSLTRLKSRTAKAPGNGRASETQPENQNE